MTGLEPANTGTTTRGLNHLATPAITSTEVKELRTKNLLTQLSLLSPKKSESKMNKSIIAYFKLAKKM